MKNLFTGLLLLLIGGSTSYLYAQDTESKQEKKIYHTKRINPHPPEIDGKLNDPAWETVEWGGDFSQWQPDAGKAPTEQTAFKILYDDKNIYIAYRCFDKEPDKIVRRMSRRDGFEGDWVEINIDSYFDHLTAFSFSLCASGVIGDEAVSNNGNNWDESWDPIWYAKTAIDDQGWTGEARIPLSQLRYSNKDKQVWGIQLTRRFFRKEERSTWAPVPANSPGWVHLFGELHGIEGIKPQKQVEIAPYIVAQVESAEQEAGNPFATGDDQRINAGVDGKIGLSGNLTLDFTINPDFGQVEADPSQVNLSAFEVFFQERRPFFIEGRNILDYRLNRSAWGGSFSRDNLFYSRRIGRRPHLYPDTKDGEYVDQPVNTSILGAFKLTGKTKKGLSIGFLESVTDTEKATIDLEGNRRKEIVEPLTKYFVGRVQQDFNKGNTQIGGMITATNRNLENSTLEAGLHKSAYSGGVDFIHNWKDRTYYVQGNFSMSQVNGSTEALLSTQTSSERFFQRPDASHVKVDSTRTSLSGTGGMLKFGRNGEGKIKFESGMTWRSPGLELNDVGFMRQGDLINQWTWIGYRILEPKGIFRRLGLNVNEFVDWNFEGVNTSRGANFNGFSQLKNYWSFGTGITVRSERIFTSDLRGGPSFKRPGGFATWIWLDSDDRKKLRFNANAEIWRSNDNGNEENFLRTSISYQPTNALSISLRPSISYNKDELQYVTTTELGDQARYILATIDQNNASVSIRVNYSIAPNLSIQYYGQPFIFKGKYKEFKRITNSLANRYEERFHLFDGSEITLDSSSDEYQVDEDQNGTIDYTFGNPDFDFLQFRSNMVARW
ncbi:MAG: DUF5916 domain-containing protein, partial [Cyclobacteriaceae bacterium]